MIIPLALPTPLRRPSGRTTRCQPSRWPSRWPRASGRWTGEARSRRSPSPPMRCCSHWTPRWAEGRGQQPGPAPRATTPPWRRSRGCRQCDESGRARFTFFFNRCRGVAEELGSEYRGFAVVCLQCVLTGWTACVLQRSRRSLSRCRG